MVEAIAQSCDIYFGVLAGGYGEFEGLGQAALAQYALYFGLGEPTGVDLPGETVSVTYIDSGHGQAFPGFLHLSRNTFQGGQSGATELFRAHEAAHQLWGVLAGWQSYRDQWLSEAFAEYSAMEYYTYRYQKPDKTRSLMRELWVKPVLRAPHEKVSTVTGEKRKLKISEINALVDGAGNVYSKGPLVIHMLRYRFNFALAAYNGGPGNVDRWRQSLPAAEMDLLVELIDITETRTYVKVVLENYAMYRFLYGGAAHPTLLASPGP